MTINCIIVDDEPSAIDVIADHINKVPYLHCVATTTDPVEALEIIENEKIPLAFCDIQMPHFSGIEFVKALQGKCKVIFTTAYSQFAIEGYDLEVLDYLLKPVAFPRFLKAAQRARDYFEKNFASRPDTEDPKYIILKGDTKSSFNKVNTADIDYIEAAGNYIAVVCGNRRIITHTKISSIENLLPAPRFFRVQKSFIVNTDKIESIRGNTINLTNEQHKEILIGNTYREAFMEYINKRTADN